MITVETSTTLIPIDDCTGRDTEIFSDHLQLTQIILITLHKSLWSDPKSWWAITSNSSASSSDHQPKNFRFPNRFKTIDQLLLKQSMTLAELIGAHVTTNSTACYGYSSSQSSLKLKPHSCLQMHGPCQMQRNGHQMDIKWTPNGSTS